MYGEEIASGSKHADNLSPVIYGGFTLVRSLNPLDIITLPSLEKLHVVITHPLIEFCLLYTSPSPRDRQKSRIPSCA